MHTKARNPTSTQPSLGWWCRDLSLVSTIVSAALFATTTSLAGQAEQQQLPISSDAKNDAAHARSTHAKLLLRDGSEICGGLDTITADTITLIAREIEATTVPGCAAQTIARSHVLALWLPLDARALRTGDIRRPDGSIGPAIESSKSFLSLEAARLRGEEGTERPKARRPINAPITSESGAATVAPRLPQGLLVLRNGERFTGSLHLVLDHVFWRHATLGCTEVVLDEVAEVTLHPAVHQPSLEERANGNQLVDVVELINGDVMRGFVESMSNNLVISIDAGPIDQTSRAPTPSVSVPITRVARVRFAETAVTRRDFAKSAESKRVARVWLRDGSIVDAHDLELSMNGVLRFSSKTMSFALDEGDSKETSRVFEQPEVQPEVIEPSHRETGTCEVAIGAVGAIALQPDAFEVVDAEHVLTAEIPGAFRVSVPRGHFTTVRGRARISDFGAATLLLEGPSNSTIATPDNQPGWMFVGEFRLKDSTIPGASAVIRVREDNTPSPKSGSVAEASFSLSAEEASHRVCIPIHGTGVEIEIRAGTHGLVGNLVEVDRAMFVRVVPPDV